MTDAEWPPDLVRAALPQAVLALLADSPRHGYQLLDELRQHGFTRVKGGTLYPMLTRLGEQGLVSHQWEHDTSGPARKVFTLTDQGRADLDHSAAAWQRMDHILTTIREGSRR